jgi:hypothetical protein
MALIPNVELITLCIFTGGYLFGKSRGIIIGATSYFIFSAFNPWGSGLAFPPLLIGQVVSMAITGFTGGLIASILSSGSPKRIKTFVFGACGTILTLMYHIIVTVTTYEFAGFSLEQFKLTALAGIAILGLPLTLVHVCMNTAFFALLIPVLIRISNQFLCKNN